MRGFIKRYIVHLEWHPGYKPHISIKRLRRPGERVLSPTEDLWADKIEQDEHGITVTFRRPSQETHGS